MNLKKIFFIVCLLIFISPSIIFAQNTTNTGQSKTIESMNGNLNVRLAPGELLPISVKLSNFGGGTRVDVSLTYRIISESGTEIFKTSDTVAVETTNNFVKTVQVPLNTLPGNYIAETSIIYPGQVNPAETEFTFKVEKRIFGLFQNDFFLYGGVMLFLGVIMTSVIFIFIKRRSFSRFVPINYSSIPHNERVFYELISDTVMDMRHKVGDSAIDIALTVDGLTIDPETGRVIKLTQSPSKIIADLVLGYEKILNQKVSFSFRESK